MPGRYRVWIFLLLWMVLAPGEARNLGELDPAVDLDDLDLDKDTISWIQSEIAEGSEDDVENNMHILDQLPKPYHITYPVQVRKGLALDLNTRDPDSRHKGGHYRHTSIQLTVYGRRLKLRLELNRELLSRGLKQKVNIDAKTQIIQESSVEGCFYQGKVRKELHTMVAVSTCNGISGVIQLRNESYVILPLEPVLDKNETRHPHVVYRTQEAGKKTCANGRGQWSSYKELHTAEHLRSIKIMKSLVEDHAVLTETKFIDLALVCDHALFQRFNNSVTSALDYLLQLANIVDAYFQLEEVRINLVYVEIWNYEDQFFVSRNPRETLHSFLKYRRRTISPTTSQMTQSVEPDVAQFITGQQFDNDEVGMAVPDSVCTERAVAVNLDSSVLDPEQAAVTLTHMIAHNLGLTHEHVPCSCPDQQGCLMSENPLGVGSQHPWLFGTCSQEDWRESLMSNMGTCLFKKPSPMLTFEQTCGNGVLERGEECDCLSPEECAETDPCCDPHTCLLKPWATCRFGDCCYNCTVMPASTMCRAPETECDVPELCDGITGQCPSNALMQDGWTCRDNTGYCYRGLCHTRTDQCQAVWGQEAVPADDKCYHKFNPTGSFNGHCGLNRTSGEYFKCRSEHVMCGLLHCAGGVDKPMIGKDFSQTKFVSNDTTYQCKILNGLTETALPHVGLVVDGTKCNGGGMCINAHCVPTSALVSGQCPRGHNGQICSGHGICTSEVRCFCFLDYAGNACGTKLNRTLTSQATTPFAVRDIPSTSTEGVPQPTRLTRRTTPATTESVQVAKTGTDASTMWLVIVLASVAGGALLLLGCCMLCYRRRSPHEEKQKKDLKKRQMFGMTVLPSSSPIKDKDSGDETASQRLISFGNLPSYRAYKIKKAQRRIAGTSETESEHSRTSARDSTEIKVPHTLPLARPPDRGILKNVPRSADNIKALVDGKRARPSELLPLFEGCKPPAHSPRDSNTTDLKMVDSEETGERTRDVGVQEDMGDGDNYSCNDSCCGSSCSSMDKKDELTPSDEDNNINNKGNNSFCGSDISQCEMPRDDSSDSLEGAKNRIIKLKNINDLLRQIDEQFNTVLKQTTDGALSPGGSDDFAGSETEADRSYPRNSFYKQSDIEEGYSPPHRSPLLSPNPPSLLHGSGSDKRSSYLSSSDKRSSNLSASSPEPLPSPSFILSPIRHRSPPRFMSPIHEGMKMPSTSSPKKRSRRRSPPRRQSPGRQTSPSRIPVRSPSKESIPERAQRSPKRQTPPRVVKQFKLPSPPSHPSSPSSQPTSPTQVASPGRRHGSPRRNPPSPNSQHFVEPPLNAVPYRGAKTSTSSIPGSPPPPVRKDSGGGGGGASPKHPENLRERLPAVDVTDGTPPKMANPYLESCQFKRGSFSNDGQSTSEGYHSDKADSDHFIVREIPVRQPNELRATPHNRISYTTTGADDSVNL